MNPVPRGARLLFIVTFLSLAHTKLGPLTLPLTVIVNKTETYSLSFASFVRDRFHSSLYRVPFAPRTIDGVSARDAAVRSGAGRLPAGPRELQQGHAASHYYVEGTAVVGTCHRTLAAAIVPPHPSLGE